MALPEVGTLLVLSGIGIPLYSTRGATQTLNPIGASSQIRRTINGEAKDFGATQFRKYDSTISCTDQRVPAVDGKWPGQLVTVDCACELSYPTAGPGPGRTIVPGSSHVIGDFTFYRPRLNMIVVDFSTSEAEWAADVTWQMELTEV